MKSKTTRYRESQQNTLESFFHSRKFSSSNLFIYGSSGTGKSSVVQSVLTNKNSNVSFIKIDTADFTSVKNVHVWNASVKFVLDLIVSKIALEFDYSHRLESLNSFDDFIKKLDRLFKYKTDKDGIDKFALVFDSAEKFLKIKFDIFQFFYKLPENFKDINFCTVFISNLPPQFFYTNTFYINPYSIEFPRYTNEMITQILLDQQPDNVDQNLFSTFVEIFLKVCLPVTNNIAELISLLKLNFEEFIEKSPSLENSDIWNQWKIIQPILKKNLSKIHSRYKVASNHQAIAISQLEIPLMTRYILISSFIASYNLSATDKKFFVQNAGKLSSRMKKVEKKTERTENRFYHPRIFPLDRLIAIYRAITVLENLPYTIMVQSQISSLCKLGLLSCATSDAPDNDKLMNPKYRCLAPFELVESISKPINFNLRAYLTDFA